MVMNTEIQNYRNAQIHGYSSLPDEWKHETSGSNKQDLKVLAFFRILLMCSLEAYFFKIAFFKKS